MNQLKLISSIFAPVMVVLFLAISIPTSYAYREKESGATAVHRIESATVDRAEVLKLFLERYNSPLAKNADTFVLVADKYNLDYRLLPAISCMESTCGNKIIPGSYNAWGWGIYGSNAIFFESFDEGIETVGKGIYEGYASKGLDTPAKMAPVYTPPMSSHWLGGVTFFMNQIDEISDGLLKQQV